MTNFSALLLGMLSLYVVAILLLVTLWRTGLLFMGMNVAWDFVLRIRRLIPRSWDGKRADDNGQ